jgi:hypothetical protein
MPAFNCALGQSPVFYNPLVALAALLLLRAWQRGNLLREGSAIMLLIGLALQIKYAAVFEGLAMGLMLLALGRRVGWPAPGWLARPPCGAAWRPQRWRRWRPMPRSTRPMRFCLPISPRCWSACPMARQAGAGWPSFRPPFLHSCCASRSIPCARHGGSIPRKPCPGVLGLWGGAAVAGFLVFGTWYDHYAGPLVAPLAVLSAPRWPAVRGGQPWPARWSGRFLLAASAIGGLVVMAGAVQNHGTAEATAPPPWCAMPRAAAAQFEGAWRCMPAARAFPQPSQHLDRRPGDRGRSGGGSAADHGQPPRRGAGFAKRAGRPLPAQPRHARRADAGTGARLCPFGEVMLGNERYALYRPR